MKNLLESFQNLPDKQKDLIFFSICLASLFADYLIPGAQPLLEITSFATFSIPVLAEMTKEILE